MLLVILLCVTVIRLVGGGASYGNVFVDNKPICDYGWGLRDAEVVCSMQNMSAVAATSRSTFGRVNSGDFGMTRVQCEGGEKDVRSCKHDTEIPSWACDGGWAAGVVCDGGNTGLYNISISLL